MKNIVVLFACEDSLHLFDKEFDGKNSYECAVYWAKSIADKVFVFADKGLGEKVKKESVVVVEDDWTVYKLLKSMSEEAQKAGCQNIVYSWADCPFLNEKLTKELLKTQQEYKAEYSFADGYPIGFAPEILDVGTASIIAELSVKDTANFAGNEKVKRDSIFSVMKTDINSFEIETVLSKTDWRMYRFSFNCSSKENLIACKRLFEISEQVSDGVCADNTDCVRFADSASGCSASDASEERTSSARDENEAIHLRFADVEKLCEKASLCAGILRTVPGFYNIQIESKYRSDCIYSPYVSALKKTSKSFERMDLGSFKSLVSQIAEFSENAVVSLSLWGEALYHPQLEAFVTEVLKYRGLSVFIETTGDQLNEEIVAKIASFANSVPPRTNGYDKVMWAVMVDSVTKEKYEEIHFVDGFEIALKAVNCLQKYFPSSVYPQFVRMNENEEQLESFYRFWSNKDSITHGRVIIQKYNSFAGLLPENKPCDLTPVVRYPDWHLRRDMVILCNGDVPLYKESMLDDCIGNVFTESLEEIWHKSDYLMENQINKKYDEISGKYDEYYTFNF